MARGTKRALVLLTTGLAALVLLAGPAEAGDYDPPPSSSVTAKGTGCDVGSAVVVTLGGEEVATTTVGSDGAYSVTYEIADGTDPADYVVTASGCDEVVGGKTVERGAALPQTGSSNTGALVRAGLVLVAAGAVLVVGIRRRQHATIDA